MTDPCILQSPDFYEKGQAEFNAYRKHWRIVYIVLSGPFIADYAVWALLKAVW